MSQPGHEGLGRWLQDGRPEPVPPGLTEHLRACDECRRELAEIDETRGWFPRDVPGPSEDALEAMQFRLQAAARQASRTPGSPPATRRPLRAWMLAAAAVLVGVVGIGLSQLGGGANDASLARIRRGPGAELRRVSAGPHEAWALSQGAARFSVRHLAPGQGFRVVVGRDSVEVRGTRFRLRATHDRLDAVEVGSGRVAVRLADGRTFEVGAGHSWTRPAARVAPPRAPPSPPALEPSAEVPAPQLALRPSPQPSPRSGEGAGGGRPQPLRSHPAPAATPTADPLDSGFSDAWQLLRAGRADAAALAFDNLLQQGGAGARRADLLYWSGRAHLRAGRPGQARGRFEELLREFPGSWHAGDAREQLERIAP